MRSIRLIALILAAGCLAPVTLAQDPAPAVAVAKPALGANPQARDALSAASAAIKKMGGVTFVAKRSLDGDIPIKMAATAQVWFVRNGSTASASSFYTKGTMNQMGKESALEAYYNGVKGEWVDDTKKEVVEKVMPGPELAPKVKNAKNNVLPLFFFDTEPFLAEMGAQQLEMGDPATADGQECQVVRIINAGNRETRVFLAKSDNLPRRVEQITPFGSGKAVYALDLEGLKAADVKPAEFKIELPAGFARRVELAPAPVSPTNTNPAVTQTPPPPPMVVRGGPAIGAPAPAWAMKPASGGTPTTLAGLKGKVVVLGFWGPIFGDSRSMLTSLEQASKSGGTEDAAFFGIACRTTPDDKGAEAARKAFADASCSFPLLLEGDAAALDYKLRGFPSVAVIDGDGNVAAFFEGSPSPEEIKAAVTAATPKK